LHGLKKHARLSSQISPNLPKQIKSYTYFIEVDIGKEKFVSHIYEEKDTCEYQNNSSDIALFLKDHAKQ